MSNEDSLSIIGRKTFIIGVDPNMLPEAYLETLLANGFETYQIMADSVCPMALKIEMVQTLYKGSIFLFYIDTPIEGIVWPQFIRELIEKHSDTMQVGILHSKRGVETERRELVAAYGQMGVQCGVTSLSYQKAQNLQILCNLLAAKGANGRRKIVRAFCNPTSEVSFSVGIKRFKAPLKDVSLSHFSCVLESAPDFISLHQHFADMQLLINGTRLRSNAELAMQRETPAGILSIFVFNKPDKTPGLSDDEYLKLSSKIYHIVTDQTREHLRACFFMLNRYKKDKGTPENIVTKVLLDLREEEEKKKKKAKPQGSHEAAPQNGAEKAPAAGESEKSGGQAAKEKAEASPAESPAQDLPPL